LPWAPAARGSNSPGPIESFPISQLQNVFSPLIVQIVGEGKNVLEVKRIWQARQPAVTD
jgi:hypothetical protein